MSKDHKKLNAESNIIETDNLMQNSRILLKQESKCRTGVNDIQSSAGGYNRC